MMTTIQYLHRLFGHCFDNQYGMGNEVVVKTTEDIAPFVRFWKNISQDGKQSEKIQGGIFSKGSIQTVHK